MHLLRNIRLLDHVIFNIHGSAEHLEENLKSTFLSYIFWFGAHRAIELGFWDVACGMLGYLENNLLCSHWLASYAPSQRILNSRSVMI